MEIHHAVDEEQVCRTRPWGQDTLGVQGLQRSLHGQRGGTARVGPLGDQQSAESDYCKVKDGIGPASVDGSLCNCTMVAIQEGIGIGCEEATTHSPIAWTWIARFCHQHLRAS